MSQRRSDLLPRYCWARIESLDSSLARAGNGACGTPSRVRYRKGKNAKRATLPIKRKKSSAAKAEMIKVKATKAKANKVKATEIKTEKRASGRTPGAARKARAAMSRHQAVIKEGNEIANRARARGEIAISKALYLDALKYGRANLGAVHPDVGSTIHNLAVLMHEGGKYPESMRLYEEALAILRSSLDMGHCKVQQCEENRRRLLRKMGLPND